MDNLCSFILLSISLFIGLFINRSSIANLSRRYRVFRQPLYIRCHYHHHHYNRHTPPPPFHHTIGTSTATTIIAMATITTISPQPSTITVTHFFITTTTVIVRPLVQPTVLESSCSTSGSRNFCSHNSST